jgi:nitrite reductase (NADH) large subunit
MKEKLVCIGNGMAGVRTLEELLKLAPEKYDITVLGTERYGNYNRILLSPVLAGEKNIDDIILNSQEWYDQNGITLYTGHTVTQINRIKREITSDQGVTVKYDRLLIATGSNPFIIPVPGHNLPGVVSFRDITDVEAMLAASRHGQYAVVIGGGLLGLEAANGLMKQGMDVTVVHLLDTLMERQLDKPAANLLKMSLEQRGIKFLMEAQTAEIMGTDQVTAVRFKDGLEIPANIVVMAVGIRPNITLAQAAGIYCERGIIVNDTMQTYDPRIYAVGECVQHRGQAYGLVAPLYEQAKVCANHLADMGIARYSGSVVSTRLKVTGIELFSAGDFLGNGKTEEIIFQDPSQGIYKKLVVENNCIKGAVMYGDTVDSAWYLQLMRDQADIGHIRDKLLFGQAYALGATPGNSADSVVALMSDDAQVCGCNGVCKGTIVKAITTEGLTTLEQVRLHTKASASCGSCSPLVEQLLAINVKDYNDTVPKKKALCHCTELSHDEVQTAIKQQHLTSIAQVFDQLAWKNPDGCPVCRPALNYYLLAHFPAEVKDDYQSRFINERVHANIQKDGTYSVVPRMWGGLTNPQELRAIANVVEKFNIPTVKMTGGQRIDLLGVKKTDLPAVWADLNQAGLVSGYAYGKAVRTVKTCVGSEWCRFGTQPAMELGIQLEKMTWGSWTPHKFKMAVSGCPRNCAEVTIKDFGVIGVEAGWEIHVGGNGGIKVRVTDLLCKVTTPEEVLEYCGAFMQLYRENARYLERTAPWIERVGLDYVQQQLVADNDNRQSLFRRFLESQHFAQVEDPWIARALGGLDAHEFKPLKQVTTREIEVVTLPEEEVA